MSAASVSCRDVTVSYDGRVVLDAASVDVEPGEWVTIIGPNGAGKSTLLRVLAGLIPDPTVTVDGASVANLSARTRAQRLAYVPQSPTIPAGMDVTNYLLLGRTPHIGAFGIESATDLDLVATLIDRLDLHQHQHQALATLSGGELQRAVIGRALAQSTPLMLLDEPTTALDIGHQHDVLLLLDRLRREHEFTIVSTMHDLTLASDFSDRLILLDNGAVKAEGQAADVLAPAVLATTYGTAVEVIEHHGRRIVVPAAPDGGRLPDQHFTGSSSPIALS